MPHVTGERGDGRRSALPVFPFRFAEIPNAIAPNATSVTVDKTAVRG